MTPEEKSACKNFSVDIDGGDVLRLWRSAMTAILLFGAMAVLTVLSISGSVIHIFTNLDR
jgi:hypothetical protein